MLFIDIKNSFNCGHKFSLKSLIIQIKCKNKAKVNKGRPLVDSLPLVCIRGGLDSLTEPKSSLRGWVWGVFFCFCWKFAMCVFLYSAWFSQCLIYKHLTPPPFHFSFSCCLRPCPRLETATQPTAAVCSTPSHFPPHCLVWSEEMKTCRWPQILKHKHTRTFLQIFYTLAYIFLHVHSHTN